MIGVVVRDNNVTANNDGIVVTHANSTIYNNYLSWNNDNGIEIIHCNGSIFYNNTVTSNLGDGIKMDHANPIIRENIITLNVDGAGIYLRDEANPIIQGNIIALNKGSGIHSDGDCSAIIQGNNITSNSGGITLKDNRQGIIQGNVIMNNPNGGISFERVPDMLIQGNIVTSNGGFGVYCGAIRQSEVHWNDIYGNSGDNMVNDDPSVTVNATYNYWGDGPERISGDILYEPWLTESIFSAEISNPLTSETVSSTVTVSTKVHAHSDVQKVEFYISGKLRYTGYDAPYEWNWNTTQYTETEHTITARAHDKFGLETCTSITVFVDNTAPTVSIKEPTAENTYGGQ